MCLGCIPFCRQKATSARKKQRSSSLDAKPLSANGQERDHQEPQQKAHEHEHSLHVFPPVPVRERWTVPLQLGLQSTAGGCAPHSVSQLARTLLKRPCIGVEVVRLVDQQLKMLTTAHHRLNIVAHDIGRLVDLILDARELVHTYGVNPRRGFPTSQPFGCAARRTCNRRESPRQPTAPPRPPPRLHKEKKKSKRRVEQYRVVVVVVLKIWCRPLFLTQRALQRPTPVPYLTTSTVA